jgi:DNA-directed RNA polymerase subunit E'/Rpb7
MIEEDTATEIFDEEEESISTNKIICYSPYTNTQLEIVLELKANQMDNDIYTHMKDNLIDIYEKKCMKSYGFIEKVYSIEELSEGVIEFENMMCSATYKVKFNCKLCMPIIGREIICKVDIMTPQIGIAVNGGIKATIIPYKINKDVFYTDSNLSIRIKENGKLLIKGDYVKLLITQVVFADKDTNIIVVSNLQNMATIKEIEMYEKEFM